MEQVEFQLTMQPTGGEVGIHLPEVVVNLVPTLDFRGLYATVLEDWLGLDATSIVKGTFEKPMFL